MTWTEITRCQHDRRALRYASDCTDAEWALIEPLMPGPSKVGATAQDLHAIGTGRDPVHCDDGMPMGGEPRGFDAGKRIKGRKRHIITDTQGNLLSAIVHPAASLRLKHGSLLRQLDNWCAASAPINQNNSEICDFNTKNRLSALARLRLARKTLKRLTA